MAAIGHVAVQPYVGLDGKQRRHGATKNKWRGEKRVTKKTRILKDVAQNGGRWF
jgi:hypothetical protein